VAEWTDACPLAGRCNECGLDFEWGDIFRPDRLGPRWCVEFARRRVLPDAVARTWGRSLWPPRLFGALKLSHEVRPWRLVLYVVSLCLVGYIVASGLQGWRAYREWDQSGRRGWRVSVSAPRYVTHAVLLPFSRKSVGTATLLRGGGFPARVYPMSSPRENWGLRRWSPPFRLFVTSAVILGAVPFTFVLLPISVRRAKVRPGHLVRITVYSTGWLFALFLVFAIGFMPRFQPDHWGLVAFFAPFAMPVALFLTWHAAIRRYLRMSQPTAVAAATVSIATLSVVLALLVLRPAFVLREIMGF
jgi:hypothetical protein